MASVFYQETDRQGVFYEDYDIEFPKHMHNHVELFYLLEGEIKISLSQDEYILKPQDVLLVSPNTIHSYESIGHTRFYIGLIETQKLGGNGRYLINKQCENPINSVDEFDCELLHCMNVLARHSSKDHLRVGDERLFGYMNIIIDYLLEKLRFFDTDQSGNEMICCILDYLAKHFQEDISLESTAKQAGINKYYLSKLFSGKICNSFTGYLSMLRVAYAKELLIRSERQMDDIALRSGFKSESSFFRNFKKLTGITPLKYRKSK